MQVCLVLWGMLHWDESHTDQGHFLLICHSSDLSLIPAPETGELNQSGWFVHLGSFFSPEVLWVV